MTLLRAKTNRIRAGTVRFGIPGFLSERGIVLRQKGVIRGILVIAISFGMTPAVAQPISDVPTEAWVARYDGPADSLNGARSVAVDEAGNVYVTGQSGALKEPSSCPPSCWWQIPIYVDDDDYATIKYDSAGNEIWVARYNGPADDNDSASSVAVDAADKVYVTGWSVGNGTNQDYATIKYDSAGKELWVARYNGPGDREDYAHSLAVDAAGNVYVTGGSVGNGGTVYGYATIKYDSAGNEIWVARYDGPGNTDEAHSLALDKVGNVYVTGWSVGNGANQDYATIKYDSTGKELWVARYNGPDNTWDQARSLALDGAGNVYVTGESDGDYATIKYDSTGKELWVARYNGPGNSYDMATSLAVDAAGDIYVTGESDGDYAAIKYDSAGNELWVARYNGPGNDSSDVVKSLAVDAAGNVYVTGESGDPSWGPSAYATIKYVQPLSGSDPRPTITANRSSGSVTIAQGTPLKIHISLDPGNQLFKKADWWIAYLGPSGLHCLTLRRGWVLCNEQVIPTVSIPLLKIPSVQILNDTNLPLGAYAFLMGVDMNMNGQLDGDSLYYDLVVVNIEDQ